MAKFFRCDVEQHILAAWIVLGDSSGGGKFSLRAAKLLKHKIGEAGIARCLLSVGALCLMLLVGGRAFPGPLQEVFQMSPQAIASHLYRFALGGLEETAPAYRQQSSDRA